MRKVVSNTTPIISLLKIDSLYLLEKIYGEIHIPVEVFNEIEAGKSKEFYTDLSKIHWIKISQISDSRAINYFLDLDKGEAEAIVLANEIEAGLILLDESLGRFYASHSGLKVTGTVGILLRAKQLGLISEVKSKLYELRSKNIWLGDNFIKKALTLANEV